VRVLVTGATGTTGATVVDELLGSEGGAEMEVLAATRDPGHYDGPAVGWGWSTPATWRRSPPKPSSGVTRVGPTTSLDHEVRYTRPGLVRYAWRRRREGTPAARVAVECGLYTAARLGLSDRVTDDVREVLGRGPRSLAEYVADRRAVWSRDGEAVPTPGVELVDRPPEALLRVANPILVRILRSPLHGLVSDVLLLLTVTGRRTGTEYTFPVGYEPRGDRLFVTTHHTNWWRNVRGGATVEMFLRGERRRGHARLVDDPDEVAGYLADALDRHGRRYATRLGLRLAGEGRPTYGRLREVAAGEIRLVVIDLDGDPVG
jgi:hypothetical protein